MNPVVRWFHQLGSPPYFDRFARAGRRAPTGLALLVMAFGLYGALFVVPADYQQGDSFRILYIHVPSAWMSMFDLRADGDLRRHRADLAHQAVRDPRDGLRADRRRVHADHARHRFDLGQADVGHVVGLGSAPDDRTDPAVPLPRRDRACTTPSTTAAPPRAPPACSRIVGVVLLPIIHYSVKWWNSLHQGQTISLIGKSHMDASMLSPLWAMVHRHPRLVRRLAARARARRQPAPRSRQGLGARSWPGRES